MADNGAWGPTAKDKTSDRLFRDMSHLLRELIELSGGRPADRVAATDEVVFQALKAIYRSGGNDGLAAGPEATGKTEEVSPQPTYNDLEADREIYGYDDFADEDSYSIQLNKWLVNAAVWAQSVRSAIDERSYNSLIEFIPWIAYFARDGRITEDGRLVSRFSVEQMLQVTGWGPNGRKRAARTLRVCSLSVTGALSPRHVRVCQNLRAEGLTPIIELLEQGRKGSGGSAYALVGIDPLPVPVTGLDGLHPDEGERSELGAR